MKFAVIRLHREAFSVAMMCRLLGVSASGFHAWAARPEPQRTRDDRALTVAVKAAFARAKGRYGSPRILRELRSEGRRSSRRRIARIMRTEGLVARPRKRRVRTTDSKHTRRIAPNLLARNFSVDAPNKVWMGDITYVATPDGWSYLAVVLDLYSRKVIGWALAEHIRDDLVLEALDMARRRRGNVRGVMHHTDRGSQYASDNYLAALQARGFVASMSRKGDCWDNAVVESFFATLKTELGEAFDDQTSARSEIGDYIDRFYNFQRLHSSLGYVSPADYEAQPRTAAGAA